MDLTFIKRLGCGGDRQESRLPQDCGVKSCKVKSSTLWDMRKRTQTSTSGQGLSLSILKASTNG